MCTTNPTFPPLELLLSPVNVEVKKNCFQRCTSLIGIHVQVISTVIHFQNKLAIKTS